jgi:hypothetical protein
VGRAFLAVIAAGVALVAPATARGATIVAYITPGQAKPNINAQKPTANPNWWMGTPQTQMTTRVPSGKNPNDYPTLQTFPTVSTQPVDKSSGANVSLPVSTCAGPPIN